VLLVKTRNVVKSVLLLVTLIASVGGATAGAATAKAFLDRFSKLHTIASMVPGSGPAKGDVNPYGVAVVPRSTGALVRGDVLVSNFNNRKNEQGTGSSIMEVSPSGSAHVFAVVPRPTSAPAVGLTTALVALKSGFVVVGSLPAPGGKASAASAGALSVLDSSGHVVKTIAGGDVNGPWDMTAVDRGSQAVLFVTNVLNGTVAAHGKNVNGGTVARITLQLSPGKTPVVSSNHVIATGFTEHTDPDALIVGPTGVGIGSNGTLYVADSANNRIAAVPAALTRTTVLGGGGTTVSKGGALNDPLGVAIAPNGDVLSMNGGNGNAIETTPSGRTAAVKRLVPNGGGDLFGLAVAPSAAGVYLVNDSGSGSAANSLQLLH
jgi:sugar lactone lactonase YvrE